MTVGGTARPHRYRHPKCISSIARPRPAPGSTLFPYTTLFRSIRRSEPTRCSVIRPSRAWSTRCPPRPSSSAGRPSSTTWARPGRAARDRKSTRLNSSHMSISYAVFCLKKKKSGNSQRNDRRRYCSATSVSASKVHFQYCTTPARTGIHTLSLHDALPIYPTVRADSMQRHPPEPCVVHPLPPAPEFVGREAELDDLGSAWSGGERSEEHTSELQSHVNLVCRLLLEKKKKREQSAQ